MPRTIYAEIPNNIGNYTVDTGGESLLKVAGSFSALGASIGSLFPGPGHVIGAGAGAVVGSVASLFGFKSGRDEVRDVMRQIVAGAVGSMMPGQLEFVGRARDIPVLVDQFEPDDISALLREIGRVTIAELPPGSDIFTDLSLAFKNLRLHTSSKIGWYEILRFQAPDLTRSAPGTTDEPLTTATGARPAGGHTGQTDGTSDRPGAGVLPLPVLAGVGAIAALFLLK